MHPFPPAKDLHFLVGKEIARVVLNPYAVQFMFADAGYITVESEIEHTDRNSNQHIYNCQSQDDRPLYLNQLLQQTITSVSSEPFLMLLTFSGGHLLKIFSNDRPYECGQIYPDNDPDSIIVF